MISERQSQQKNGAWGPGYRELKSVASEAKKQTQSRDWLSQRAWLWRESRRYCKSCVCVHGEDDGGDLATFIGEKEKLQKRRVGDLRGLGARSPQEPVVWSTGERWATPRAWRVESTWGQRDACRCGATKLSKFMSHASYVLERPEAKA